MQSMKCMKEAMAFIEFIRILLEESKGSKCEQIRKEVMEGGEL